VITPYPQASVASATPPSRYAITNLGTLPQGTYSIARAINDLGWVVGESGVGQFIHAFVYSPNASPLLPMDGVGMIDLGTLGGRFSVATGVDAIGRVVGYSETSSGAVHAFIWPRGGPLRDLGTLGGQNSYATGIVANGTGELGGQVIGFSEMGDGSIRAFAHSGGYGGPLTGTLAIQGVPTSAAAGINSAGVIVGDFKSVNGLAHAISYEGNRPMELGTLGGQNSSASAINRAGQIIGTAQTTAGNLHAFLYSDGVMQDLGALGGATSLAWAINEAGLVVGSATISGDSSQGFLYHGDMVSLNALVPAGSGWELSMATGINGAAQIVGVGLYNQRRTAFLMTPL
jgi:probable HAF family extracellular repeat protein